MVGNEHLVREPVVALEPRDALDGLEPRSGQTLGHFGGSGARLRFGGPCGVAEIDEGLPQSGSDGGVRSILSSDTRKVISGDPISRVLKRAKLMTAC